MKLKKYKSLLKDVTHSLKSQRIVLCVQSDHNKIPCDILHSRVNHHQFCLGKNTYIIQNF